MRVVPISEIALRVAMTKIVGYDLQNLTWDEFGHKLQEIARIQSHMDERDPGYNAVTIPSPANHIKYYSETTDNDFFMKQARELTAARVYYAFISTRVRFKQILETYTFGLEYFNCHAMIASTRSMIELIAHFYSLFRNLDRLSGTHIDRGGSFKKFKARAIECELILIKYSHGSRSDQLRQIRESLKPELSNIIPAEEIDLDTMKSGNIMNKLDKLSGLDSKINWKQEYDKLSDRLHPNVEQGSIHEFISDEFDGAIEIVTKDVRTRGRAIDLTIIPMHSAIKHLFELLNNTKFPFGDPEFVFGDQKCRFCQISLSSRQALERGVCSRCVNQKKGCKSCGAKLSNRESKSRGTCFKCFELGLSE